jgi:hypothetical protein
MRGIEPVSWLYDAICAVAEWRGLARWRRWIADGARRARQPSPLRCPASRRGYNALVSLLSRRETPGAAAIAGAVLARLAAELVRQ